MSAANDVHGHLADLSDAALTAAAKTASDDLAEAAATEPGSEWHEACFAGAIIYATEMQKRGLTLATIH